MDQQGQGRRVDSNHRPRSTRRSAGAGQFHRSGPRRADSCRPVDPRLYAAAGFRCVRFDQWPGPDSHPGRIAVGSVIYLDTSAMVKLVAQSQNQGNLSVGSTVTPMRRWSPAPSVTSNSSALPGALEMLQQPPRSGWLRRLTPWYSRTPLRRRRGRSVPPSSGHSMRFIWQPPTCNGADFRRSACTTIVSSPQLASSSCRLLRPASPDARRARTGHPFLSWWLPSSPRRPPVRRAARSGRFLEVHHSDRRLNPSAAEELAVYRLLT